MSLTNAFEALLNDTPVTAERFREVTGRLFASGVIFRDENPFEERMYDDARRILPILNEYFSLSGFRLFHDADSTFMRLYPPGVWVPGHGDPEAEGEKLLRSRLSADFVGTALMLRFLYQQGLAEGRLEANEEVHVRMEDLALSMTAHLGRALPEGKTDRGNLFRELKRQRVLRFNEEADFNNGDGFIAIRRPILSLVGEEALTAALDLAESRKPATIEVTAEVVSGMELPPATIDAALTGEAATANTTRTRNATLAALLATDPVIAKFPSEDATVQANDAALTTAAQSFGAEHFSDAPALAALAA